MSLCFHVFSRIWNHLVFESCPSQREEAGKLLGSRVDNFWRGNDLLFVFVLNWDLWIHRNISDRNERLLNASEYGNTSLRIGERKILAYNFKHRVDILLWRENSLHLHDRVHTEQIRKLRSNSCLHDIPDGANFLASMLPLLLVSSVLEHQGFHKV